MPPSPGRRWLDEGVWSCRIKLPPGQSHIDNTRALNLVKNEPSTDMSAAATMDSPLETTSPRRKNEIADALQNMPNMNHHMDGLDLPTDPDAQATVTDFLDFTEYLPSDLIRSFTLIGKLDQAHEKAQRTLTDQIATYEKLPSLPAGARPDPLKLRGDISEAMADTVRVRQQAYAEVCRTAENLQRYYARLQSIDNKLHKTLDDYPASRESSPQPQKSKSPQVTRGGPKPKITLRYEGAARATGEQASTRVRRRRVPRITVPGEVLAPYELDYESYDSESDSSSEDDRISARATPGRNVGGGTIKLKINKASKQRAQKPPRQPRPPGMGTNVHSSVAGISTSNALAKLQPPPEDAVLGSSDAPWLQLTAWELAKLRKRMKKNAVWSPSDTMIARELKLLGRGIEAYRAAKSKADEAGEPLTHSIQPLVDGDDGTRVYQEGAISADALEKEEVQLSNRGMKLNEAKKLKRENQAKELAKLAAEEAEDSARKVAKAAEAVKDLFSNADAAADKKSSKTPKKAAPKRKRELEPENAESTEVSSMKPSLPQPKRTKTETPIPVPQPIVAALESSQSTSSDTAPPSVTDTTPVPVPPPSPKKSSTPILPPGTAKKDSKKEVKKPQPIRTSTRHSSAAPVSTPTEVQEQLPAKRPTSSRAAISRPTSRGKAASVEPATTVAKDRPRRASTVHNTPAPEVRPSSSRRTKRPAPGIVTGGAGIEGAKAVSKRSAAPKKKGSKKQKDEKSGVVMEVMDEVDDEGNIIDPNEPRYCICNRVSFGTMIGCESADCEKEWFHLDCVGLTDIPPRTTKWYCPDCRVKLGLGERGEVTARGKKK